MELVDDSVGLQHEAHFISKDEQKSMQDLPLILRGVVSNRSNMHHPIADTYIFHFHFNSGSDGCQAAKEQFDCLSTAVKN